MGKQWGSASAEGQFPLRLDYGRSPHAYVKQRLQIQLELLMMSGVPLETFWVFNERWNNKFYYKVASCWLFLLSHTTMHEFMNIKFMFCNSLVCLGQHLADIDDRVMWMLQPWLPWLQCLLGRRLWQDLWGWLPVVWRTSFLVYQ
jgi:hypothetical protein